MVDTETKGIMESIPWWYTEIGEIEKTELLDAFAQKRFSLGRISAQLEIRLAQTLGVPDVVLTNSGTSALTMALLVAGAKPGDEVIVPALTWIATAQAAAVLGIRVILADCLPDYPLIDPSDVRKKITPRTKAIIPVHLNGRSADLGALELIAQASGATLIEDTCKGLMSRKEGACLGTLADLGCFSLGMISLLSVGYGGFVTSHHPDWCDKLRVIRDHGVIRDPEQYAYLGSNFKISDLLAAVGLGQLSRLDEKIGHVQRIYQQYKEGLSDLEAVQLLPIEVDSGRLPLYVEIFTPDRDQLVAYLRKNGVETSRYHLPLSHAEYLGSQGELPNAERWASGILILPSGPSQPSENVDRCIELLRSWR